VSAPSDYDNGEIGGMIGRGNRITRRNPAPVPLCRPQTPHAARTRTRAAAVGSQRLTAELRHGHKRKSKDRFQRRLTMVCDTQDYWVIELCPSFRLLNDTNEHIVSETGGNVGGRGGSHFLSKELVVT
jgi:hypothetical protein